MTSILDAADDAFWWLAHRWRAVVPALVGVAAVVVLLVVLTGGDDKPKVPADAVATVGGTPITTATLDHWQEVFQKTGAQSGLSATDARKAAFRMLAQAGWIDAEAAKQDATVTKAQLDASEKQLIASYKASKQQVLTQLGISEADLRMTQRTSLLTTALQKKVVAKVPNATDAQAQAQYAAEPELWAHPSARDARLLVAGSASDAQKAISALKAGTDFSKVAQQYSVDADLASSGGAVKGVKPGSTGEPALEHAFFSAQTGSIEGPVKTSSGYAVFKVQRIVPSPAQTEAQAAAAIKNDLKGTQQAEAIKDYVAQVQKRWKAKTACRSSVQDSTVCGTSV